MTVANGNKLQQKIIDVDMRGQVCPSTLLVALNHMNRHRQELQSGEAKLCIKTDNREAIATIPSTAQNMGYFTKVAKEQAHYEICITSQPPEAV